MIIFLTDPITIRDKGPQNNYYIKTGDVLNLAVFAATDPSFTLQYKWMFINHIGNETEIQSNKYWEISWPIQNNLTIDVRNVTKDIFDSLTGYYSVKIYHNIDLRIVNFTVELGKARNMETDISPGEGEPQT